MFSGMINKVFYLHLEDPLTGQLRMSFPAYFVMIFEKNRLFNTENYDALMMTPFITGHCS